jgi:arylsulfatase A-like enzyme
VRLPSHLLASHPALPDAPRPPAGGWAARRLGVLALFLALLLSGAGCGRRERPRGIVLVVIDTLRADHLSAYGNPRPVSPHIDALARGGVLFEHAFTHAPWTLPAFVGLLSGSYPSRRVFERRLQVSEVEALRDAGFATAAFTEGGFVSSYFGIDRGFQTFQAREAAVHLQGPDLTEKADEPGGIERTFAAAGAWLRAHADRPFFLMVHTYEVHVPYLRTDLARRLPRGALPKPVYDVPTVAAVASGRIPVGPVEVAYVRALYDGGVAAADRAVGGLLDLLDTLGIAERTLVVVTADHGEELGERRPSRLGMHGDYLYDTLLHVPLVLRGPGVGAHGRRIATPVRLIDVMPTILDLAGVPAPVHADGRSLAPLLDGAEGRPRPDYAEVTQPQSPEVPRRVALRDGHHKLIVNLPPLAPDEVPAELYDLEADPGETHNLAAADPALEDSLAAQLREHREALEQRGRAAMAADTDVPTNLRDQLRALGYTR